MICLCGTKEGKKAAHFGIVTLSPLHKHQVLFVVINGRNDSIIMNVIKTKMSVRYIQSKITQTFSLFYFGT